MWAINLSAITVGLLSINNWITMASLRQKQAILHLYGPYTAICQ